MNFSLTKLFITSVNYLRELHSIICVTSSQDLHLITNALYYQARDVAFNVTNCDRITIYVWLQFSSCTQLNATIVLHRQVTTHR